MQVEVPAKEATCTESPYYVSSSTESDEGADDSSSWMGYTEESDRKDLGSNRGINVSQKSEGNSSACGSPLLLPYDYLKNLTQPDHTTSPR